MRSGQPFDSAAASPSSHAVANGITRGLPGTANSKTMASNLASMSLDAMRVHATQHSGGSDRKEKGSNHLPASPRGVSLPTKGIC